jgi:heptosyltransferase-2
MKIGVRAPNWIGDCIMFLPALRALKDNCPGEKIFLVSKHYLSGVFRNLDEIDEIITIPDKAGFRNLFGAAARLKNYRIEAGILFTNSFNSALLFRLAGIKKLTGYNKDLRGFLLSERLKFPGNEDKNHHVLFYRDIVEAFTGKKIEKKFSEELVISGKEKKEVAALLVSRFAVNLSKTIIGISPSAAFGSAKQWPPERFAELLQRIRRYNRECEILLFGSGQEREKTARLVAQAGSGKIYNLAGELTLREAITAVSLCNLFISNDSGLMHVASSLRIPLIALFGPTLPHKTSPLFREAAVLHYPVACAPCKHRDCPLDHRCMKAITVDEVYEELKNKIQIQQDNDE